MTFIAVRNSIRPNDPSEIASAVDVVTSPELRISSPHLLFEQRYAFGSAQSVASYDVSPDGQRFLMVKDESSSGRLNVVLHWLEELKARVPTK